MVRGKDLSDFERGFIVGARMAGASVTRTAQLASVSIGTVAKVTSAFRATGKTSVSRVGNCGRQRTLDDRDARALVQFVKKNRSATLAQVTQNLNAGRNQTVSTRTVRRQLHREGYYKESPAPPVKVVSPASAPVTPFKAVKLCCKPLWLSRGVL
uniref:Transposase Tc1-like domain-containing protein n=1 Tax=Stegastes partitus TaxID=144197 RepID=A0A3B4YW54_9TELE